MGLVGVLLLLLVLRQTPGKSSLRKEEGVYWLLALGWNSSEKGGQGSLGQLAALHLQSGSRE